MGASGRTLQIINVLGCVVSVIVVTLRVYVRTFIVRKVATDDYCMIISVFAAVAAAGMIGTAVTDGLGNAKPSLLAAKLSFLCGVPVSICQTFGRVSFAFTLLTLMGTTKTRRWLLYFLMCMQFIVSFVGLVLAYGMCSPIEVFWNTSLKESESCVELYHWVVVDHWQFAQDAWNALTDFALALFPTLIIGQLQMRASLKLGLIGLMSLGVFAGVITIVKSIEFRILYKDPTHSSYTQSDIFIWTVVQEYVVIIAASIASIKPLFGSRGKSGKVFGTSYGIGSWGRRLLFTRHSSKPTTRASTRMNAPAGSFVPLDGKNIRLETSFETLNPSRKKGGGDSDSGEYILQEQGVPARNIRRTTEWDVDFGKGVRSAGDSV